MPRQRAHYGRVTYQAPHDFPERLERLKEESGLSGAEIVRRLDIHHETLRRWRKGRARPSMRNMMALVALARACGRRRRKRKKGVTHGRASPHPHPSTRRCLTGPAASS